MWKIEGERLRDVPETKETVDGQCSTGEEPEMNARPDMLSNSAREFLHTMFDTVMTRIEEKLKPLCRGVEELKKDISEIKETVRTVELYVEGMKPNGSSTQSKSEEEMKTDSRLTKFPVCFPEDVVRKVLKGVVTNYFSTRPNELIDLKRMEAEEHRKSGEEVVECAKSFVLASFLFSRNPSQPKTVWKDEVGVEASKMRKKIVYSIIVNVQRNRFDQFMFKSNDGEIDGETTQSACSMKEKKRAVNENLCTMNERSSSSNIVEKAERKKIEQPRWLSQLCEEHIEIVRNQKENRREIKKKMELDSLQIRATKKIFSLVIVELSECRNRGRSVFFDEIGYALCLWRKYFKEHEFKAEQPSFTSEGEVTGSTIIELEKVPLLNTASCKEALKSNEEIVTKFLDECRHMTYRIRHEAVLRTENSVRSASKRRIVRNVNIMHVAIQFFLSLFGDTSFSTKEEMVRDLSSNEMNLRCAAVFGSVFNSIVQQYISRVEVTVDEKSAGNWEKDLRCGYVVLEDLCPTPSLQSKTYQKMVLNVTPDTISDKGFDIDEMVENIDTACEGGVGEQDEEDGGYGADGESFLLI